MSIDPNNKNTNKNAPKEDPDNTKKTKKIISLVIIALVFTIIINLIHTSISNSYLKKITYSDFIDQLVAGQVAEVEVREDRFLILTREEAAKDKAKQVIYYTGRMTDYTDGRLIENMEAAGVVTDGHIVEEMSPLLSILVSWVVPVLIFYLLFSLLTRSMGKHMGGGIGGIGQSKAKMYMEKETGVTFADVAGQDEAKESMVEIIDFIHHPQKYTAIGAKLPKGALLVGSPGTGKTLLAKAVAGEAKVPFFSISGSDFVEMFVGVGASRVRDLFQQASKVAPAIVFIDEIDAIGRTRDSKFGGNDEREQTLNQLLAELDGFDSSKGVVILAATNRPEILDKALLRPGRFDRRIEVDRPNLQGRYQTLRVHTKNIKLAEDVDLQKIAQATAGAVGADLANLVNEAALRAVRLGRKTVNQEDLLVSFEVVIAGTEKKGTVLTETEKRMVAYHEVGHALVSALQKHTMPVTKITIVPHTSGALGYTLHMPEEEKFLSSREELLTELETLLAGRAAEQIVFGSMTTGAANDIERATEVARRMITQYGMSEKFGLMALSTVSNPYLDGSTMMNCADVTAAQADEEIKVLLAKCYEKACSVLRENRTLLDEIALFLLQKETITGDEFMTYVNADKKQLPETTEETATEETDTKESE